MILENPTNGAEIKKDVGGFIWQLKVGEKLNFPEAIGGELLKTYGFLKKVEGNGVVAKLEQVGNKYRCSLGDFESEHKIGVLGHMRSHPKAEEVGAENAKPLGKVERRPTLYEARRQRLEEFGSLEVPQGIETYGEGYQEEKKT